MKIPHAAVTLAILLSLPTSAALHGANAATSTASAGAAAARGDPSENLPPNVRRVTWFGERADWSHDGKRILFLEKTFGDVFELEVATGHIRSLTAGFPHHGFTRALYLANGDILLSGPETFDPMKPGGARTQCFLFVLGHDLKSPPVSLGTKCSEGPAVSRTRMHIAWTHVSAQDPENLPKGASQILEADIVTTDGKPALANQRLVLDSRDLPFRCTLETQNFVQPAETALTFSAYDFQGTDAFVLDLATKKATNQSNAPEQYDEPEGIFPDGKFTLVESDKQNHQGSRHVDLWKLALDGSGAMERLTFFSDSPGFKASNGVVSDDGRFMAFQLAKSADAAGVGYGIFVMDLKK